MKKILLLGLIAIIFITGCTQQKTQIENFTETKEKAEETIEGIRRSMGMQITIESARSKTLKDVEVSIRNTGIVDINLEEIEAFIDEEPKNIKGNIGILKPGQPTSFNITEVTNPCNKVLKIIIESGLEDYATIMC